MLLYRLVSGHPILLRAVALTVIATGCGDDEPVPDAQPADAHPADAGAMDAPQLDGGPQRDASDEHLCGFDELLVWEPLGEILQLESMDRGTCVWLMRRNDCPPDGICKAVPFTLLSLRVGHDGMMVEIDDPDALTWESTHHNWCDLGVATTESLRFELEVVLTQDFELTYELRALDRGSSAMLWSERLLPFQPPAQGWLVPATWTWEEVQQTCDNLPAAQ